MNELCYYKNALNHLKSQFADKQLLGNEPVGCTYTMMDDRSLTEQVGAPPTYEFITEVLPYLLRPGTIDARPNERTMNE